MHGGSHDGYECLGGFHCRFGGHEYVSVKAKVPTYSRLWPGEYPPCVLGLMMDLSGHGSSCCRSR